MTEATSENKQLIFVVGMHRSGTSVVTRCLNLMGAKVGDRLIEDQKEINIDGFWEHESVVEINQQLLAQNDSSWFDTQPLPEKWKGQSGIKRKITSLLKQDFNNSLSVIKDPRLCLTLSLWRDCAVKLGFDVSVVYVVRHPVEVCKSLEARDPFSIEINEFLWLKYNLYALNALEKMNVFFIDYGSFLQDTDGFSKEVRKYFDSLAWKKTGYSKAISELVDSGKRRQMATEEEPLSTLDLDITPTLYHHLKELNLSGEQSGEFSAAKFSDYASLVVKQRVFHKLLFDASRKMVASNHKLFQLGENYADAMSVIAKREEAIRTQGDYLQRAEQLVKERDSAILFHESENQKNVLLLKDLEEKFRAVEKNLFEQVEQIENLRSIITEKDIGLQQHETAIQDMESTITELQHSLQNAQEERIKNIERLEQANDLLQQLEEELQTQGKMLENAHRVINEREDQIRQQGTYLEQAQELVKERDNAVAFHESESIKNVALFKDAEKTARKYENELKLARESLQELREKTSAEINEIGLKLQSATEVITEREQTIREQGGLLARAESLVEERDEAIAFLEEELRNNVSLLKHAEEVVLQREKTMRDAQHYLEQVEQGYELRLKEQDKKLEEYFAIIESQKSEKTKQKKEIESVRDSLAEANTKILEIKEQLSIAETNIRKKNKELIAINDELLEWNSDKKIADLKMQLLKANKDIAALEKTGSLHADVQTEVGRLTKH